VIGLPSRSRILFCLIYGFLATPGPRLGEWLSIRYLRLLLMSSRGLREVWDAVKSAILRVAVKQIRRTVAQDIRRPPVPQAFPGASVGTLRTACDDASELHARQLGAERELGGAHIWCCPALPRSTACVSASSPVAWLLHERSVGHGRGCAAHPGSGIPPQGGT
jgi:hypothetical protein